MDREREIDVRRLHGENQQRKRGAFTMKMQKKQRAAEIAIQKIADQED
jgi:hypothetical protein